MPDIVMQATGWKRLDGILNTIIEEINQRTMLQGNGISITEVPNGSIIGLKVAAEDQKGGPSDAGWQSLIVIDSVSCTKKYIWYWGTPATDNPNSPPPKTKPISA